MKKFTLHLSLMAFILCIFLNSGFLKTFPWRLLKSSGGKQFVGMFEKHSMTCFSNSSKDNRACKKACD